MATSYSAHAQNKEKLPQDVKRFLHDAEICQYLSGEWDESLPRERKIILSKEMDKMCSDISLRQSRIKKKYYDNKIIMKQITLTIFEIFSCARDDLYMRNIVDIKNS
ncbi:MAG: hypothetical protein ABF785_01195 [Acetobacter papayae]|uniref:hypothetical protein n=1 Tax=Acetobacter papayae TaxID=1076592 RepID=UPI0039EC827E